MRATHRLKIVSWLLLLLAGSAASQAEADSALVKLAEAPLAVPFFGSQNPDLGTGWTAQIEWAWTQLDDLSPPGSRDAVLSTTTTVNHRVGRWQAELSLRSLHFLGETSDPLRDTFDIEASTGIGLGPRGLLQTILRGERVDGNPAAMTVLIRWSGVFTW